MLECKGVAVEQRPHYRKWLRCYWDFCHKYAFEPTERQSLPAFHEKLRAKNQPEALCRQAEQAVTLYYEMVFSNGTPGRVQPAEAATPPGAANKLSATHRLEQSHSSPSPAGELVTGTPARWPPLPISRAPLPSSLHGRSKPLCPLRACARHRRPRRHHPLQRQRSVRGMTIRKALFRSE